MYEDKESQDIFCVDSLIIDESGCYYKMAPDEKSAVRVNDGCLFDITDKKEAKVVFFASSLKRMLDTSGFESPDFQPRQEFLKFMHECISNGICVEPFVENFYFYDGMWKIHPNAVLQSGFASSEAVQYYSKYISLAEKLYRQETPFSSTDEMQANERMSKLMSGVVVSFVDSSERNDFEFSKYCPGVP